MSLRAMIKWNGSVFKRYENTFSTEFLKHSDMFSLSPTSCTFLSQVYLMLKYLTLCFASKFRLWHTTEQVVIIFKKMMYVVLKKVKPLIW